MKQKNNTAQMFTAAVLSMVILLISLAFMPNDEYKIYDSVIRLHVLANSDSDGDQAVKLLVRDAIIDAGGDIFTSRGEDFEAIRSNIEQIKVELIEKANEVLSENGYTYKADAEWGLEAYPTREYDGISFPAGEYYSLRVYLGEGAGENWWCVLFPPLCLTASSAKTFLIDRAKDPISEDGFNVFTKPEAPRYYFRFKFMDLFS